MTSVDTTVGQKTQAEKKQGKMWFWPALPSLICWAVFIAAIMISLRVYQQWAGWEFGLDASHPNFQTYWMNLFYIQVAVIGAIAIAFWSWIWISRDRHVNEITPQEEVRRTFTFASFLCLYVFSVYCLAASLPNRTPLGTRSRFGTPALRPITSFCFTELSRSTS